MNQIAAATLHLRVGSTLAMEALSDVGLPGSGTGPGSAVPPRRLRERVVGIVVTRSSVDPVTDIDKVAFILASPALAHQLGPGYRAFDGAFVKLKPGGHGRQHQRRGAGTGPPVPGHRGAGLRGRRAYAGGHDRAGHPARGHRAGHLRAGAGLHRAADRRPGRYPAAAGGGRRQPRARRPGYDPGPAGGGRPDRDGGGRRGRGHPRGRGRGRGVAAHADRGGPARRADPGISADWPVLLVGAATIVVLLTARTVWPAWRLAAVRAAAGREAATGTGRRSRLAGSRGRARR